MLGHLFCFGVLSLNIDGTFFFASVGFWMALGSGAFWVLTAQIIMDEGGIKNFGMNWGLAVTFNFLGFFTFLMITYFLNFKVAMGVVYMITGLLIPTFSFLAWHFD